MRASLDTPEAVAQAFGENSEAANLLETLGPDYVSPSWYVGEKANLQALFARLANKQGRHSEAKAHAAESIRLFQGHVWRGGEWDARVNLADAHLRLGKYELAREQFLEAQRLGDKLLTLDKRMSHARKWAACEPWAAIDKWMNDANADWRSCATG